jgi:hypothetical protein
MSYVGTASRFVVAISSRRGEVATASVPPLRLAPRAEDFA